MTVKELEAILAAYPGSMEFRLRWRDNGAEGETYLELEEGDIREVDYTDLSGNTRRILAI